MLPKGKLICAQNGTSQKWYHSNGHTKDYIPKKNRKLAEQLLTSPEYQNLLAPYFTPQSLELAEWMNASYVRNPLYPDHLPSPHPSNLLLGTFRTDGLLRVCTKCLFQATALHRSQYYSIYSTHHHLRNQGASSAFKNCGKYHCTILLIMHQGHRPLL